VRVVPRGLECGGAAEPRSVQRDYTQPAVAHELRRGLSEAGTAARGEPDAVPVKDGTADVLAPAPHLEAGADGVDPALGAEIHRP
jgi:hypothetical protein